MKKNKTNTRAKAAKMQPRPETQERLNAFSDKLTALCKQEGFSFQAGDFRDHRAHRTVTIVS